MILLLGHNTILVQIVSESWTIKAAEGERGNVTFPYQGGDSHFFECFVRLKDFSLGVVAEWVIKDTDRAE